MAVQLIDSYAYQNRIRHVDPACKAGLALTTLGLCLLLDKPGVGAAAVIWMYLLAMGLAGLNWRVFGKILLVEAGFLGLATVGVVLDVSGTRPAGNVLWALPVGPLWCFTSPAALRQGMGLIFRALGAAAAMNFLSLTTPLVDLLELARRWHVPAILVDLLMMIYRFLFVLLEQLYTMTMAQESRLGYLTSYRRAMNNAGLLGGRLIIKTFQRGRNLEMALESRGYEGGDLPVLSISYPADTRLMWLSLAVGASLGVVGWLT